jgi:hypothetical protein
MADPRVGAVQLHYRQPSGSTAASDEESRALSCYLHVSLLAVADSAIATPSVFSDVAETPALVGDETPAQRNNPPPPRKKRHARA